MYRHETWNFFHRFRSGCRTDGLRSAAPSKVTAPIHTVECSRSCYSLLLRGNAAAEITTDMEVGPSQPAREHSPLGVVPHSIRGFLYRHQQVLPATEAFYNCTACSPLVLERYSTDGYSFLQQVFNNPDFLEQVSGLAELHKELPSVEVESLINYLHARRVSHFTFTRLFSKDWDYPESSSDADSAI